MNEEESWELKSVVKDTNNPKLQAWMYILDGWIRMDEFTEAATALGSFRSEDFWDVPTRLKFLSRRENSPRREFYNIFWPTKYRHAWVSNKTPTDY